VNKALSCTSAPARGGNEAPLAQAGTLRCYRLKSGIHIGSLRSDKLKVNQRVG
jgi:hypothetical protein